MIIPRNWRGAKVDTLVLFSTKLFKSKIIKRKVTVGRNTIPHTHHSLLDQRQFVLKSGCTGTVLQSKSPNSRYVFLQTRLLLSYYEDYFSRRLQSFWDRPQKMRKSFYCKGRQTFKLVLVPAPYTKYLYPTIIIEHPTTLKQDEIRLMWKLDLWNYNGPPRLQLFC